METEMPRADGKVVLIAAQLTLFDHHQITTSLS